MHAFNIIMIYHAHNNPLVDMVGTAACARKEEEELVDVVEKVACAREKEEELGVVVGTGTRVGVVNSGTLG
jgi:hypothetical protein